MDGIDNSRAELRIDFNNALRLQRLRGSDGEEFQEGTLSTGTPTQILAALEAPPTCRQLVAFTRKQWCLSPSLI